MIVTVKVPTSKRVQAYKFIVVEVNVESILQGKELVPTLEMLLEYEVWPQ